MIALISTLDGVTRLGCALRAGGKLSNVLIQDVTVVSFDQEVRNEAAQAGYRLGSSLIIVNRKMGVGGYSSKAILHAIGYFRERLAAPRSISTHFTLYNSLFRILERAATGVELTEPSPFLWSYQSALNQELRIAQTGEKVAIDGATPAAAIAQLKIALDQVIAL